MKTVRIKESQIKKLMKEYIGDEEEYGRYDLTDDDIKIDTELSGFNMGTEDDEEDEYDGLFKHDFMIDDYDSYYQSL